MRLRRFFVDGLTPGISGAVSEFLLFHGVGTVEVIDRPDVRKLQIECYYNSEASA